MAYALPEIPAPEKDPRAQARDPSSTEERQHVSWLQLNPAKRGRDPYRYVLLLRFTLLNLIGFGLLGAAYAHGLVAMALEADRTYLSLIIFLAFLVGLGLCAYRVWQTSQELNSVRDFEAGADSPATPRAARIWWARYV